MNPMVNAGAIATTSLIPGDTAEEKLERIRDGLSKVAGRSLGEPAIRYMFFLYWFRSAYCWYSTAICGSTGGRGDGQDVASLAQIRERLPPTDRGSQATRMDCRGGKRAATHCFDCRKIRPGGDRGTDRIRPSPCCPRSRLPSRQLLQAICCDDDRSTGDSQTDQEKQAMTERFYWAQCVKDETMAESIVSALEKSAPAAPKPEATGDLSFTTTVRSTATSVRHRRARPPPRPQEPSVSHLDAPGRRSRRPDACWRRPQTRRLSGLHHKITSNL